MNLFADHSLRSIFAGALLVFAGCVRQREDRDEPSLKHSFKEVMAFDAPAAVSSIKAAHSRSGESHKWWLSFVCDDATIAAIRKLDGGRRPAEAGFSYLKGDDSPDPRDGTSPEAPLWWNRAAEAPGFEQITTGQVQSNRTSVVTDIWIDEKTHTVYARRVETN